MVEYNHHNNYNNDDRRRRNTFTEQLLCPKNCAKCFRVLSYSTLKKKKNAVQ